MISKVKKTFLILIGVVVFLFLAVFGLNYLIENKLKEQINQVPENVKIRYEAIEVNSLKGRVTLVKPLISVYEKTADKINTQIELEYLSVDDFSYLNYFLNDKIIIGDILFNRPTITYYRNDTVKSVSYKEEFIKKLKQIIQIESIKIRDAHVEVYDVSNDDLLLKSKNLNLKIDEVQISPLSEKNPIIYSGFKVTSDSIFYRLNEYEELVMEQLDVNADFSKFKGITLKTKYSKEALSKKIRLERDHYDLTIDSIEIKKQDFGFLQDTLFYFKSQRVDFYQPNFKVYRDKLVADDMRYKPLYSKMLRDLNFRLTLNAVFLNNTSITYTERVKIDNKGGKLSFSKLQGEIKNLSNTYLSDDTITSVNIKSVFMNSTPMDVQWDFNVNDLHDKFIFKAKLGKLNADIMNQFMEPNLNLQLKGKIDKAYFTINGNALTSHIDLRLKYDDFNVLVLKENGQEKNKILSSIVNIFVSKNSYDSSEDFRYGSKSNVERTKNRSVFNYLWLNIRAGLLNAMTGNGKEK